MKINDIAHILRASREITGEDVFVVIGSQAVLVQFPDRSLPDGMLQSNEIDIWPKERPELSDLIEGALGNGSSFHAHFGYHADGVGPETAILPAGWWDRAISLGGHPLLNGAIAICPEIHDLAVSKISAFREKDIDWVEAGIAALLINPDILLERLDDIPVRDDFPSEKRKLVKSWIAARTRSNDFQPG